MTKTQDLQAQRENGQKQKMLQAMRPLLAWYEKEKRQLPWREDADPYRIWVSEIMLQQTRVEAVKPYYARFLAAFPDIAALAAADEAKLMKCWEGLGYYNRARNMQKAAKMMAEQYGGQMPKEYDQVLALPGIGSYTAGAICAIAYGLPRPAVDGNVLRVLSRLFGSEQDIAKPQVRRGMEMLLRDVMCAYMEETDDECERRQFPGRFNQALMELGAIVCVPNGIAKCDRCPLAALCEAKKQDRVLSLPYKTEKKPRRIEEKTIFLLRGQNGVAIRKRPAKGLLAGLYEFPNTEGFLSDTQALSHVRALGFSAIRIRLLPPAKHIFTHVEWHMQAYLVQLDETQPQPDAPWVYADADALAAKYAFPSAFAAYRDFLQLLAD